MNNEDIKVLEEYVEEFNENKKKYKMVYSTGFGKYWTDFVQAIENLIKGYKDLEEENRFLKYHEYTNICQCCKKTFYSKRPEVLWCKNCRTKMYNINYYANLSDEKKKERAEKSKISMRKHRKKLQEGDK